MSRERHVLNNGRDKQNSDNHSMTAGKDLKYLKTQTQTISLTQTKMGVKIIAPFFQIALQQRQFNILYLSLLNSKYRHFLKMSWNFSICLATIVISENNCCQLFCCIFFAVYVIFIRSNTIQLKIRFSICWHQNK